MLFSIRLQPRAQPDVNRIAFCFPKRYFVLFRSGPNARFGQAGEIEHYRQHVRSQRKTRRR